MPDFINEGKKKDILRSYREIDMHKELKILFEHIHKEYTNVYITHGPEEYGRDLIISTQGPMRKNNTSIVVKMDKLSGKNIDPSVHEISMQTKQSFEIDLNVKDEIDVLKTDFVYILIFGEISKQARINLDISIKEYKGRYKIYDITDITKLFTQHYSEVFLGASGYEALSRKFIELEDVLKRKSNLLATSYIEPNLKSYDRTKQLLASTGKVNKDSLVENIFGKKETISSLIKRMSSHNINMFIDGGAGSGKTVFTIKLIQRMISDVINNISSKKSKTSSPKIKVPILISATSLKNGNIKNLEIIIEKYYIDASFKLEPSILIIDGLDEVAQKDREYIVAAVTSYTVNKCSLLITSRKSAEIRELLTTFLHLELLEFESSQVINFIQKTLQGNEILIQSLVKGVEQLKKQIPMYPMSLTLLIEIAQTQKEVPASIAELYSRYLELVIGDKNNGENSIHILFEPKIKEEFLTNLAFDLFYKNNASVISKSSFDSYLETYVKEHSHISSTEDFMHDISRLSILVLDNDVHFLHKSFLDYFIAKYFIKEVDSMETNEHESIYRLYYSSLWEDVTFFYFGIKSKISRIQIEKILSFSRDEIQKSGKEIEKFDNNSQLIEFLSQYQLGRLIQYAWNTKNDDKIFAIEVSAKASLELKIAMYKFQNEDTGMELPGIVSDVAMLHFTDLNFSSLFLESQVTEVITKTLETLNNIEEDSFKKNMAFQSEFYFSNLYILANIKKLDKDYIKLFISTLIKNESKIPAELSLPLFALFDLLKKNRTAVEKDQHEQIDKIRKKLIKKYGKLSNEIFIFKNKIHQSRLKKLTN